jgi:multiple sugar transport system permease protein
MPRASFWFLLPAGATLALVLVGPMLFALRASFTGWSLTDPGSDHDWVGWANYTDLLSSAE